MSLRLKRRSHKLRSYKYVVNLNYPRLCLIVDYKTNTDYCLIKPNSEELID